MGAEALCNLRHRRRLKKTSTRDEQKNIKRRWIVVRIEKELEENEVPLPMKGLDFAITPRHVLAKEILTLVESAMRNLPHKRQDMNRSEVHSYLRQANVAKDRNLTREKQEP